MNLAQIERIALLAEELSEAAALCGKILRHGFDSYNPDDPGRLPNSTLLARELGDVEYAINLLTENDELERSEIHFGRKLAIEKKPKYLHHQGK